MLRPTVMKPIWLREEQASTRFRSTENSASNAPRNMVMAPRVSSASPNQQSPCIRLAQITINPNTPDLVRIPLSSALAGAGATGCALGNQMCRGNRPALAAKPTRVSHTATVSPERSVRVAAAAFMPAKDSVPS